MMLQMMLPWARWQLRSLHTSWMRALTPLTTTATIRLEALGDPTLSASRWIFARYALVVNTQVLIY